MSGDRGRQHAERAAHHPPRPEPRGPADLAQPRGRRLEVVAAGDEVLDELVHGDEAGEVPGRASGRHAAW